MMATFMPRSPQQPQSQQQQQANHSPAPRSPMEKSSNLQKYPHTRPYRARFSMALETCLQDFVIQLLPTHEEMAVKEDVRKLLERLIRTIEPQSKLLSFGSTANGFSLRNSDMDLCCLVESDTAPMAASEMVQVLGSLLERETKFRVKPLPHARIPIIKLTLDPSQSLPFGIACDIGFENRLALENTRLLLSYATVDPTRVRTMVLFLKVWSKRRKINSPYQGTLSSYGYVLLVLYFLIHVKNPPVLPNLQTMPPLRPVPYAETHLHGHNVWFFDDIELLRKRWKSSNAENVAELLIDFFAFYSRDFQYATDVASIRGGLLRKDQKGWFNESDTIVARDCNRLCIEDPFEITYNVARTVTKEGLFLIRGEFMRASNILSTRTQSAISTLAHLCLEREDIYPGPTPLFQPSQTPNATSPSFPPSPSLLSIRPSGAIPIRAPGSPSSSKPSESPAPSPPKVNQQPPSSKEPTPAGQPVAPPRFGANRGNQDILAATEPIPEHMAPTRSTWTSPPPPDAPSDVKASYEEFLGLGLSLATAASDAREKERARSYSSSSKSNSDYALDEELVNLNTDMEALDVSSSVGSTGSRSPPEKGLSDQVDLAQVAQVVPVDVEEFESQQALTPTPDAVPASHMDKPGKQRQSYVDPRLRGRPPIRIPSAKTASQAAPAGSSRHRYQGDASSVAGPSHSSGSPSWNDSAFRSLSGPGASTPTGPMLPYTSPVSFSYGVASASHDTIPQAGPEPTPETLAMNLSIFSYQQQNLVQQHLQQQQSQYHQPLYNESPHNHTRFQPQQQYSTYSPPRFSSNDTSPSSPRGMQYTAYGGLPSMASPAGSSPQQRAKMYASRGQGLPVYQGQSRGTPRPFRSGSNSGRSRSGSEASPSPLRQSIDLPPGPSSPVPNGQQDLRSRRSSQTGSVTPGQTNGTRSPSGIGTRAKRLSSDVGQQLTANGPALVEVDLPLEPPPAHLATPPTGHARRVPPRGGGRKGGSGSRRHSPTLPDVGEDRVGTPGSDGQPRNRVGLSDLDLPGDRPSSSSDVLVVPTGIVDST